jgi:hypothetical protein
MIFFNKLGEANDQAAKAQRNAVTAPEPALAVADPLDGRDVALYVDGKRVSVLEQRVFQEDGRLYVEFATVLDAALEGGDAHLVQAWGGFKPGQHVIIKPAGQPRWGVMHILTVVPPKAAGDPAFFDGEAMTPIYDMQTGQKIADAGERCRVLTSYVVAMD